jgi:hypothetical protein
MMAVIEIERSHRESVEKGRKVRAAHAESKRKARDEGRIWHRSGPTWATFNESTKKFDLIPHKAEAVRAIFDLIEKGMGTTAIAKKFNVAGVETPRGKVGEWHHSAVLEIVRNPSVIGIYQPKMAVGGNRASRRPHDGEPIEGYYPAVIDRSQFYRVQTIIAGRSPKRGNSTKSFANLFVGLCQCNTCFGTVGMHVAAKHDRWTRSSVLQCVDARRGLCQNKHRYKYQPIEDAILRHVREFVPPHLRDASTLTAQLAQAEAERDDLTKKIDNLMEHMEAGEAGILARYQARAAELKAKDAAIADLRQARLAEGSATMPIAGRQEAIQSLLDQMAAADGDDLYRLRAAVSASLRSVIQWIEFYEEEVQGIAGERTGETFNDHYVMVRMVGDENTYLIDAHTVSIWPNDGNAEKVWSEWDDVA